MPKEKNVVPLNDKQISLAIISYHKAADRFELPNVIDEETALKIVISKCSEPKTRFALLAGPTCSYHNMSVVLGIKKPRYLEYCQQITKEKQPYEKPKIEQKFTFKLIRER